MGKVDFPSWTIVRNTSCHFFVFRGRVPPQFSLSYELLNAHWTMQKDFLSSCQCHI